MVVLDALSVCSTGVAGWLAESRCVKREVSRPQVADGYGRGSRNGHKKGPSKGVTFSDLSPEQSEEQKRSQKKKRCSNLFIRTWTPQPTILSTILLFIAFGIEPYFL